MSSPLTPDKPPDRPPPDPEAPPQFIKIERYENGELDVPIEGAPLTYDPPFASWCTHHFTVLDPSPNSIIVRPNTVPGSVARLIVRTKSDSVTGCFVQIVIQHPPEMVGKDEKGNLLIANVEEEPVAGHIAWTAVGDD